MVEISDFTIIEVTLAIMGVILIPIIRHFYKSDIKKTEELTKINGRLEHLEASDSKAEKEHAEIRTSVAKICDELKDINTRLSRMEGSK